MYERQLLVCTQTTTPTPMATATKTKTTTTKNLSNVNPTRHIMARSFVVFFSLSQHTEDYRKHQRPKYWEYEVYADLAAYRWLHNTYESLEYIKQKQMRSRFGFYRFSYARSLGSVGSLARSCRKLHTKRTNSKSISTHSSLCALSPYSRRNKNKKKRVLSAASCCWLVDAHTHEKFHVPSPVVPFNVRAGFFSSFVSFFVAFCQNHKQFRLCFAWTVSSNYGIWCLMTLVTDAPSRVAGPLRTFQLQSLSFSSL